MNKYIIGSKNIYIKYINNFYFIPDIIFTKNPKKAQKFTKEYKDYIFSKFLRPELWRAYQVFK